MKPWERLREQVVYRDRWVEVRWTDVRLPDGRSYRYTALRRVPGVAVVAINEGGALLLQEEYRYPLGRTVLQLPGGLVDPGEAPLADARRELREETGYEAQVWEWLGDVQDNPGLMEGVTILFLARELRRVGTPCLEATERLTTRWYPWPEVRERIGRGLVEDRVLLAAVAFLYARGDVV